MYYLLWFSYVILKQGELFLLACDFGGHWPHEAPVGKKERLVYHVYNDNEYEV